MHVELGDLGFEEGGALLVKRALRLAGPGAPVTVSGAAPEFAVHLRSWCRLEWHSLERFDGANAVVLAGPAGAARWAGAERTGLPDASMPKAVVEHPPRRWGLAARGALIEAGSPEFVFLLNEKTEVWSGDAGRIYAQGAAAQWDPATAIPWNSDFDLPVEVEDAVVQIMTYLIENETAALVVPSRFVSQFHPHFREVMQALALQVADEARHIEVFTRRALLKRGARTFHRRRTNFAQDACGRAGFRGRFVSALRARRGHLPVAAMVSGTVRARSGYGGCLPPRGAR